MRAQSDIIILVILTARGSKFQFQGTQLWDFQLFRTETREKTCMRRYLPITSSQRCESCQSAYDDDSDAYLNSSLRKKYKDW